MKGQSAMEYLMTYGWAILIIAIVLVALFELGIFGGQTLPTSCVQQAPFVCSSPVYATPGVSVTIGQTSGQTYYTVNAFFLDSTEVATFTSGPPSVPSGVTQNTIGTMYSGAEYTANVVGSIASPTLGSSISGQIWIQYSTTSGGTPNQYAEVGLLNAKYT